MSVPDDAPQPVLKFSEIDFGEDINKYLSGQFDCPTPIQAQACEFHPTNTQILVERLYKEGMAKRNFL